MTYETSHFRRLTAAFAGVAMIASALTSGAAASSYVVAEAEYEVVPTGGEFQVAAADCYAVGQQVAAQKGGELYGANNANRGGQEVCVVVVVIPPQNGKPPRRIEVVVPAG